MEGLEIPSVDDILKKIRDIVKESAVEKVRILGNKRWFNQEFSEFANKRKYQNYFGYKIQMTKLQEILVILGKLVETSRNRNIIT